MKAFANRSKTAAPRYSSPAFRGPAKLTRRMESPAGKRDVNIFKRESRRV